MLALKKMKKEVDTQDGILGRFRKNRRRREYFKINSNPLLLTIPFKLKKQRGILKTGILTVEYSPKT